MNGRKLFREYAQERHRKVAKEFVRIENELYSNDTLVTKDNTGMEERCTINYRDMVHWIINTRKLT